MPQEGEIAMQEPYVSSSDTPDGSYLSPEVDPVVDTPPHTQDFASLAEPGVPWQQIAAEYVANAPKLRHYILVALAIPTVLALGVATFAGAVTGELGAFIGFAAVTWTISAVLTAPIGVLIYLIRRFSYRAAFNIGLKENGYRGPVIPSPESF